MQNLQNIIRKNIGIYFPRFLCELVRVKAGSRVMILLRCTTSNGTCSYYLLSKQSNLVLEERTSQTRSGEFMAYQFYRFPGNSGDVRQVRGIDHFLGQTKKLWNTCRIAKTSSQVLDFCTITTFRELIHTNMWKSWSWLLLSASDVVFLTPARQDSTLCPQDY
jgi:hypothetical protein